MRITSELIRRCSSRNLLPGSGDEKNFERITHLFLQEHHIKIIENLECCKNLTALYLYENKIGKIENLDHLEQLKILYLHCNIIIRMENLNMLSQLTVLNLGHNAITKVEGLEGLTELRELYIEYQTLSGDQVLEFDPETVIWISECLRVLNVSGNRLERLSPLRPLKCLEVLVAEENELNDLEELAEVAGSWKFLLNLKLVGNPVCARRKYVDELVVSCVELEELDGKVIQQSHRNFLLNRRQCLALESLKKESYQVLKPFLETRKILPVASDLERENPSVLQPTTSYFDAWYNKRVVPFWHNLKSKCSNATVSLKSAVKKKWEPTKKSVRCLRCQTNFLLPDPRTAAKLPKLPSAGSWVYVEGRPEVLRSLRRISTEKGEFLTIDLVKKEVEEERVGEKKRVEEEETPKSGPDAVVRSKRKWEASLGSGVRKKSRK